MRALRATAASATNEDAIRALRLESVPTPEPRPGQVLVRIHAASCNPADLLYLTGRYGIDRPLPATPGFEGAGEVVASGGGLLGRWLLGKRVIAGGHECTGTWADYCVTAATQCMPLHASLSYEQGAVALANPMTAFALVSLARKGGHRALVQTAAAGTLARVVRHAAAAASLPVLDIVRRASQAEPLRAAGAEVLVSEDPDFLSILTARARVLSATFAIDAVAGAMTGLLLNALPPGAEVVVYGALSGDPSGAIDPMKLAFGDRRIRGFEIAGHLRTIGLFRTLRLGRAAQRLLVSGAVQAEIRDRTSLENAPAELLRYVREMSLGKILIVPGADPAVP